MTSVRFLGRSAPVALLAGLAMLGLSGCDRGGSDHGSLNEQGNAVIDEPPPPPENVVVPPVNTVAPVQDVIIDPVVSTEEQTVEDAEATGMTARTRPVAPPVGEGSQAEDIAIAPTGNSGEAPAAEGQAQ